MLDRANHTDIESPAPSLQHFCFLLFEKAGECEREEARKKKKIAAQVISVRLRESNVTEKSSLFFSRKSKNWPTSCGSRAGWREEPYVCVTGCVSTRTRLFCPSPLFTHFQHNVSQPAVVIDLFCVCQTLPLIIKCVVKKMIRFFNASVKLKAFVASWWKFHKVNSK